MAQENSVLFALRDLRTLESDRLAEEARVAAAAAERRRVQEERRCAEEERRRDEEEARRLAQRRADEAAAEMARALRESAGRNEQLESDVQTLRALVSAVQQPAPRTRPHWPMVLVGIALLALAGALWARRAPVVRERIVYTPAPVVAPPVVAPVVHPAALPPPPPRPEPARPKRPAVHVHKTAPAVPSELPSILDCVGTKDPLCGTKL